MLPLIIAALGLASGLHADQPALGSLFDGSAGEVSLPAPDAPVPPVPGTKWVAADPGGTDDDDDVSAPDKQSFWAYMQDHAFDEICRQAQIPASASHRFADVIEPEGAALRYLRLLPTGELAIIDEDRLALDLGWLPDRNWDIGRLHTSASLSFGARLAGTSMVIRRLPSKKACDELKRIPNLKDIKLVLPLTGARIAKMKEGEIWRLPLTLQLGLGGPGGDSVRFPVTIALGAHREGDTTVTLRRLDANTVRLRLRFEEARLLDAGGKVSANIPVLMFGLPGASNFLLRALSSTLAESLDEFLAVQLDTEFHRRDGAQEALEFLLDPRDPAAMDRLARVLRGDLSSLSLLKRTVGLAPKPTRPEDWLELVDGTLDAHERALGAKAQFGGVDRYHRGERSIGASVPFLWQYERTKSNQTDHIALEGPEGGRYDLYRAEKRARRAYLDIPILGQMFTRNTQKDADVVVHRGADGKADGPAIVYVQQEGFVRQDGKDAREMAERADELMSLAGARGNGENAATALPVDGLFPEKDGQKDPRYQRGVSALTVVLSAEAVQEILSATPQAVVAACRNAADAITPRFFHGADYLAQAAASLAKTLGRAAKAATPEAQAKAIANLLSGSAKHGLEYGKVLDVLVQLVDPLQISAEYFVDAVKAKGGETRARYLLNPDSGDQKLLEAAAEARARFQQPSPLTD